MQRAGQTGGPPAELVRIEARGVSLEGNLALAREPRGLILFAHGSGSSRHSPRNQQVARTLEEAGFATLLFDLLTAEEDERDARTRRLRFDVELLAGRLGGATDWAMAQPRTRELRIGYFGASTGAAAALAAAAERPEAARAVVSRGGRPDLAHEALGRVRAATLLVVGGNDPTVLELNRAALDRIAAEKELAVVPGATHLFEEPGTLEDVAQRACAWFERYLAPADGAPWEGER